MPSMFPIVAGLAVGGGIYYLMKKKGDSEGVEKHPKPGAPGKDMVSKDKEVITEKSVTVPASIKSTQAVPNPSPSTSPRPAATRLHQSQGFSTELLDKRIEDSLGATAPGLIV